MSKAAPQKQSSKPAPQPPSGQIVKASDLSLTQAPDYLEALAAAGNIGAGEGFEEVRATDVKVPLIKIAQKGTPEADEDNPSYVAGLKKGHFFHSVTGELYGAELRFVPLFKTGNRILFKAMDEGGGILCRSMDMRQGVGEPGGACAKCPLSQFGSARDGQGKGTACSEFFNFPVLVYANGKLLLEPAILSFKSTGIDAAKHLIGLAMRRRLTIQQNGAAQQIKAPMWSGVYKATTKNVVDGQMSWYEPIIDNAGWVPREDVAMVKGAFDAMNQLRIEGRLATDQEAAEA